MKIIFIILLSFWAGAVQLAADDRAHQAETGGKAYAEANYNKIERCITMRDGARLFTSVYCPKDTLTKHPMLIVRTPYSCSPYGSEFPDQFNSHYYGTYILEGYILVFQDVRGRYLSEGTYEQIRPFAASGGSKPSVTDEGTDTYDSIEWLLKNVPGNNGNVGLTGCSYPGFYAFGGALCGHPAVKAVSPQAPVTDWFLGDDIHHNGAFCLSDAFGFIPWIELKQPPAMSYPALPSFIPEGQSLYDFFLSAGCIDSLTEVLGTYGEGFWKEVTDHPDYDGFWQERSTSGLCSDIGPAVLVVGGEYDAEDLYGSVTLYRAIRQQSPETDCRFAFGPWKHGGWMKSPIPQYDMDFNYHYFFTMELPFFNYYLKGEGTPEDFPKALVFETGSDEWLEFDDWSSSSTFGQVNFALEAGSRLSMDTFPQLTHRQRHRRAASRKPIATYVSDPACPVPSYRPGKKGKSYMYEDQSYLEGRKDAAPFKSGVLEDGLTIAGPVEVELTVSVSTTDADFVVKLLDEDSTGCQRLVRGDIMPARFRNGFEKPEQMKPGKRTKVGFTMPDVCHTFQKGHRVVVVVQSSWFPLFAMNPQSFTDNIYKCSPEMFISSEISLYGGSLKIRRLP